MRGTLLYGPGDIRVNDRPDPQSSSRRMPSSASPAPCICGSACSLCPKSGPGGIRCGLRSQDWDEGVKALHRGR